MNDSPHRWQISLRRLAAGVIVACVVLAILRHMELADGVGPAIAVYIAFSAAAVRAC